MQSTTEIIETSRNKNKKKKTKQNSGKKIKKEKLGTSLMERNSHRPCLFIPPPSPFFSSPSVGLEKKSIFFWIRAE
jgi:hypothetical protein